MLLNIRDFERHLDNVHQAAFTFNYMCAPNTLHVQRVAM